MLVCIFPECVRSGMAGVYGSEDLTPVYADPTSVSGRYEFWRGVRINWKHLECLVYMSGRMSSSLISMDVTCSGGLFFVLCDTRTTGSLSLCSGGSSHGIRVRRVVSRCVQAGLDTHM
jgi:hypothetical protein